MQLKLSKEVDRCKRVMRERVEPHIHRTLGTCEVSAYKNPGEPESSSSFLQRAACGQVEFAPLPKGEPWGTTWGTTWMRVTGTVPADRPAGMPVELIFNLGWIPGGIPGGHIEAMAYRPDGTVIKAVHPRNYWVSLVDADGKADGVVAEDGSFLIHVEGAYNPNVPSFTPTEMGTKPTGKADERYEFGSIDLTLLDPQMLAFWADLDVVSSAVESISPDDPRQHKLARAMQRAMNAWDEGDYSTLSVARSKLHDVLQKPANASAMTLSAMGHAHIDSAWLWPVRETHRKVARTVSNVLALMDEDPDFIHVMSSPQQYAWLEQEHPDLFERVRRRVAEGRFIPVGGMWVESDGNLPSGESLIRQISFGKRYFKEKFDVVPQGVWLPDSFGYTGAWPQIARRSGYRWFLTQKLCWNDTTRPPHQSFMWEGIDGSQIFTHFPPADKYDSDLTARDLAYVQNNYRDKDFSDRGILLFGYGDGGGGPTREMALRERRLRDFEGLPRVQYDTPDAFFAKAESEMKAEAGEEMPYWRGELYFQLHRKTLTSQQDMKRGCRTEESLLRTVEYLGTYASLVNPDYEYPTERLDAIWKTLLLNQFHDILPGSSIEWVYRVAKEQYRNDCAELGRLARQAINAIAEANPTVGLIGRARIAQAGIAGHRAWAPVEQGASGSEVELQANDDGSYDCANAGIRMHILPNGAICSLFDIAAQRQMVAPGSYLGRYEILKDEPGVFDAWDVERDAFLDTTKLDDGVISEVKRNDDGSVTFRVVNSFRASGIETYITMPAEGSVLRFHADVDWQVPEKMLKVDVPVALHPRYAQYECQYGMVERPIAKNTDGQEAMFESCSHRFVRIADSDYAIGVANASTYGCDVAELRGTGGAISGTMVRLTLVAAPKAPDPRADIGRHRFDWVVTPCAEPGELVGVASLLNAPVLRDVPAIQPLIGLSDVKGVPIVDWVKPADDGSGDVVARLYEAVGGHAHANIVTASAMSGWQVRETNTLEQDESYEDEPAGLLSDGPVAADGAVLELGPFQLCTLRFSPVGPKK